MLYCSSIGERTKKFKGITKIEKVSNIKHIIPQLTSYIVKFIMIELNLDIISLNESQCLQYS